MKSMSFLSPLLSTIKQSFSKTTLIYDIGKLRLRQYLHSLWLFILNVKLNIEQSGQQSFNLLWIEEVAYDITYHPPTIQYCLYCIPYKVWMVVKPHLGSPSPNLLHDSWLGQRLTHDLTTL